MRRLLHTLCLFSGCVFLVGCSQRSPEAIVLGHLAVLSGPEKAIGEEEKQGILLAVEEANQREDRVLGKPIEVRHADIYGPIERRQLDDERRLEKDKARRGETSLDGERLAAEAVRLLAVHKVAGLIGGDDSSQAEQLARTAQSYAAPTVTLSGRATGTIYENVFSIGTTPAQRGEALGRYAVEDLKWTMIAVITDGRSPACNSFAEAFLREFSKSAATTAKQFSFKADGNFAAIVSQAKEQRPNALLIAAAQSEFRKLRAALFDAGVSAPLLFGGEDEGSVVPGGEVGAVPIHWATALAREGNPAAYQEFSRRYQERFTKEPSLHAVFAYEAVTLLLHGMRQAKSKDPLEVRKALAALTDFDTLTGAAKVLKGQQQFKRPISILQAQNASVKMMKRYEADK